MATKTTRHSATYYKYYNEDGTRKQSTSSASSASKSTAKTTTTTTNHTSGSMGFSTATKSNASTFKPSSYGTKNTQSVANVAKTAPKQETKITLPKKQETTTKQAESKSSVMPSLSTLKNGFKPNGFAALTLDERNKREFADSSKRTFDQWDYTHKAQNSLEEWEQSSNELINRIRNLGSGYRGKTYEYTELRDTMKGLLYAAGDWKKQYADDAGVQNRIDTMLKALNQESGRITDYENYYSQFTDAKDYERQVLEPMKQAGWQDKYNSLTWSERERALNQLDPTGEEYTWLKQYNESGMGYSATEARNGITALERQLAAKQAAYNATIEGTNYDGTNVAAYARQIDDLKNRISKLKSAEYFALMRGEYGAVPQTSEYYKYSKGNKRYASDDVYAAINGINTNKIDATDIELQGRLTDYYDLMTDEERGTYNTLYAVEGKKSADKYLEYISYDLNARKVDKQTQELMEFQQAHPWAAGILGTVQGAASRLFGGAEAYLGIAYQNARNAFGEYRPVDYNSATMDQFRVGNTLIQLNAQHIADNTGTLHFNNKEHPILYSFFEGKSLADLYQLGISMGESATVAALSPFTGGASVALLGMSAATQGVLDAVAKGASDEQALLMGTFNGAFEMLFEELSLEQLTDLFLNGTDNMIRSVVWQMLTEGTEEVNTTLANTIADAVIMGSKSDWQLAKAEYMANGQSEAAATISAMTDVLIGAAWDFVGGAVSGGVMGGFGGMVGNINYGSQYGGDAQQLVTEALELDPSNSLAQKAKAKLDKGGDLSGGTIRRLVGFNENTIRSSDRQAISSAAAQRLTELGETGNVNAIADAIAKAIDNEAKLNEKPANRNLFQMAAGAIGNVTGIEALNEYANTPKPTFADKHFNPDRMTADDRAIIDGSKYGGTVLQELQNGVMSWTSTLPVERIAPEKYARDLNEQQKTERKAEVKKAVEQPPKKEKSFDEWDNERRAKGDEWNGETKPSRTPEAKTLLSKTAAVKTEDGEGTITGLVYDGGNVKANVKTESGVEAVELDELKGVPQGIADAMEIMSNRFGEIAPAVWASYQEGQNMEDYINGASIIYELGKSSAKSWAEIKDSVMRLATTKALNEAQAEVIFNEAKRVKAPEQQPRAVSKDAGKVSGRKVKFGNVTMQGADLRNLKNDTEKQVVSLARQIAKATGINIIFYREGTLSHLGAQKANNIYLNLDNIKDGKAFVMQTMSHELTHFIKEYNPEVYNMLRDFVVDKLLIKESGRDLGQLINDKQAREKGLSYSRAIDEVVADGCEMMLQNSEAVQLLAQQDESLTQKIAKWVKSFVAKIKALFENLDPKHEEAAELMKYADELQQIWDYALADAVGKARAETVSAADNGNISENVSTNSRADNVFAYSLAEEGMSIEDYKKALKESQDALKAAEKKNAELMKRYTELRRNVGMAMPEARADDVKKFTNRIAKKYSSKGSAAEVLPLMQRLGNYVARGNAKMETLIDRAGGIAEIIAENAIEVVDPALELRTAIKESLKAEKYYLDPKDRADLVEPYGDFSKRYRKYFTLSKDGGSIDAKWVELRDQFGDLFPADITSPADKLTHIAELMNSLQPEYINPFAAEMVKATEAIRTDIIDALLGDEIREYDMPSTKIEVKYEQEVKDLNALVKQLKKDKRELKKQGKRLVNEALKEQAARIDERLETERLEKAVKRKKDNLLKKLNNRTPKSHVPHVFEEPTLRLLQSLDDNTITRIATGKLRAKDLAYLDSMREIVALLRNAASDTSRKSKVENYYYDLPEGMIEDIETYVQRVTNAYNKAREDGEYYERAGGLSTLEELDILDEFLGVVTHSIIGVNDLFANSRSGSVQRLAERTISETALLRNATEKFRKLDNFAYWQQALPYYAFKRYGNGAFSIFESFMEGMDKFAKNSRQVIDWAKQQWTDKEVQEWEREKHKIELESGDTIEMTTAQVMNFFMHTRRTQSMDHMLAGGIQIAGGNNVTYLLTIGDVINIRGVLTERQFEVADKMQKYMSTVGSDWGNEISFKRFGYLAFREAFYVPIKVADGSAGTAKPTAEVRSLYTLVNKSFTKNTQINANNPLIIDNAFDVFGDHMTDIAKYNALGLPLVDALKWFNYGYSEKLNDDPDDARKVYHSVRDSMLQAFGKNGVNYFLKFIEDINSKRDGGRVDGAIGALTSTFKAAAVGFNIRVAIQQPTAYVRASALIDPKYLAKALGGRNNTKEMLEHSGIAIWKDMGFYDTNIGRNVRDQIKSGGNILDKTKEFGMSLAELGDQTTWGRIWKACKLEQQTKGFTGDALIEATDKRFREVIYATQVVDGTMTRSQLMRGTDAMSKAVTAFRSEPTLTYNLVANTAMNWYDAVRRGEKKGNIWKKQGKTITRVLATYVAGSLATAAAAAIADAIRDDDEYEQYWEKWLEAMKGEDGWWKGNIWGELNPLDKLPIISDIYSAIIEGNKSEQMFLQAFTEMRETYNAIVKYNSEGKGRTLYGVIYKGLQTISHLSGLGIGNGTRDAVGLYNTVITLYNDTIGRITGNKLEDMKVRTFDNGDENDIKDAVLGGHISEDEAEKLLVKKGFVEAKSNRTAEDEAYWTVKEWLYEDLFGEDYSRMAEVLIAIDTGVGYDEAVKEMLNHGYTTSEIQSSIRSKAKEWFLDGYNDKATTENILSTYGGVEDENDRYWLFKKWDVESVDNDDEENNDDTFSRYDELVSAMFNGKDISAQVKELTEHGVAEKDITSAITTNIGNQYKDGKITETKAVELLMKYNEKEAEKAYNKVMHWDFVTDHPEYKDMTETAAVNWYNIVEDSGVSLEMYYQYWKDTNGLQGEDNDGDGKKDAWTRVDKVAAYIKNIDGLTVEQQKALYLADKDTKETQLKRYW